MLLSSSLLLTLSLSAPQELPLWPDGVPGAPQTALEETLWGEAPDRRARDVHVPTLTVYRAAGGNNSGAAVVICPGGGYRHLALDKEGHEIAAWFQELGVTACVLKYRLPRPEGHVYAEEAPLQDLARALALVREHAREWVIDPLRLGVMGFSAGGHLAASASTLLPDETRPSFALLIYPVISMELDIANRGSREQLLGPAPSDELVRRYSCEQQVSKTTPQTFLLSTSDDPVDARNALRYYLALKEAGVPAEVHVFGSGGHGYGMRAHGEPVNVWPDLLLEWMSSRGLLLGR